MPAVNQTRCYSCIYLLGQQGPVQGNKEALATVTGIVDGTGSVGAALGQVSMNRVLLFLYFVCADMPEQTV